MGKIILFWKTLKLLPKRNWLTFFTIGAVRVCYNHHWLTKSGT